MARRKHRRRRARAAVIMMNPRRRRRRRHHRPHRVRRHHRRRRNPGFGTGIKSALRQTFMTGIPAIVAGGLSGFIDSKFLSARSLLLRIAAKIGEAAAAGMLLRRRPVAAYAAMGAIIGSVGYEQGVAFAGGVIAGASPAAKAAGVQALITEDPRTMGVLVRSMQGMGYTLDQNVSLGAGTALDSGLPVNSYTDVNLG